METAHHYVLIIGDGTAGGPALLDRVRRRIIRSPCRFTLVVPAEECPGRDALRKALPRLEEAAEGPVEGEVGPTDAVRAAEEAMNRRHFDEVIVATADNPASDWLAHDVPGRIARRDVPVAVVVAEAA